MTREIPLPCGRVAIVPASEYERLIRHKWYYNKSKKLVRSERNAERGAISLHREVMRAPDDMQVNAIDGNYLKCTWDNLQLGRPKPRPWEGWERHLIEGMHKVGCTNREIAQELGNGRTAVGVRMALKRWENGDGGPAKRKPNTYRDKSRTWQELCQRPLVKIDLVTGEMLVWRWIEWHNTSGPAPQPAISAGLAGQW